MIHNVRSFFLHAVSNQLSPETKIQLTVFVPNKAANATIALSTVTVGAQPGSDGNLQMGWAGCVVLKGGFVDANNQTQITPKATSFEQNQLALDHCAFMTYQISVALGEAIAVASLYTYEEQVAPQLRSLAPARHALVFHRVTGEVHTVHHLQALPGARVPSDRFLLKAVRECAAEELKLSPASLAASIHQSKGFRYRAGMMVDPKTGKLRK
jgi:hypothetical protein